MLKNSLNKKDLLWYKRGEKKNFFPLFKYLVKSFPHAERGVWEVYKIVQVNTMLDIKCIYFVSRLSSR